MAQHHSHLKNPASCTNVTSSNFSDPPDGPQVHIRWVILHQISILQHQHAPPVDAEPLTSSHALKQKQLSLNEPAAKKKTKTRSCRKCGKLGGPNGCRGRPG